MSFENNPTETERRPDIKAEPQYSDFIPAEFVNNPIQYFETYGTNMKEGEVLKDENGTVREDPTAVKELPEWLNGRGEKLAVVAKKVNNEKGKIRKFGDPLYEYRIMKIVLDAGLPAAEPIATVHSEAESLIVMKKLSGIGGHERGMNELRARGFSEEDIMNIKTKAGAMMAELREKFEAEGIKRSWDLKDMIIDIDFAAKKVISLTPVDWEKTKIEE